jgi:hypothetical protein
LEYKDTIVKTFRHVGLALDPNGSEDYDLKIKDLPNIAVGDYHREDLSQDMENDEVMATVLTTANKQEGKEGEIPEISNIVQSDNESAEDQPRDRYYTRQEALGGNPRVGNNQKDMTTDTEGNSSVEEGEEESDDNEFDPEEDLDNLAKTREDLNML